MFTQDNPSPRYQYLLEQYRSLHAEGEKRLGLPPEAVFPGQSLFPQMKRIKRLIDMTGARSLLDYGCGKGRQYDPVTEPVHGLAVGETVMDYWEVDNVHCYDPCYSPYSRRPEGRFDAVISTDVLEHCPEEDIPWIVDDIFKRADLFVFANVACYPAKKHLPDGQNAHCTIKSVSWWEEVFNRAAAPYPNLIWDVWIQYLDESGRKTLIERRIGNSERAP